MFNFEKYWLLLPCIPCSREIKLNCAFAHSCSEREENLAPKINYLALVLDNHSTFHITATCSPHLKSTGVKKDKCLKHPLPQPGKDCAGRLWAPPPRTGFCRTDVRTYGAPTPPLRHPVYNTLLSKRAPCPFQRHFGAHKLGQHSQLPTQGFVGSDQLMRCQGEKAWPYLDIQVKRREKSEPRSASLCRSLAVTGLPLFGWLCIVG